MVPVHCMLGKEPLGDVGTSIAGADRGTKKKKRKKKGRRKEDRSGKESAERERGLKFDRGVWPPRVQEQDGGHRHRQYA